MDEPLLGKCAPRRIDHVISVCEAKDLGTWKLAAVRVLRHIRATSYELICPDAQVQAFRDATPVGWQITGESAYSANCSQEMIHRIALGANRNRVNWIFQQFLKINAAKARDEDDIVLIWDADTIPLRELEFIDPSDGKLLCYHSREVHQPYFDSMQKLLGFGKACEPSFIAQCLPVRAGWVTEMVCEIEDRFSVPYPEAVMSVLPGISGSEFSEYETIGTWAWVKRPGEIALRDRNRWMRRGSSFFGTSPGALRAKLLLAVMSWHFDFVAIENWKTPGLSSKLLTRIRKFRAGGGSI